MDAALRLPALKERIDEWIGDHGYLQNMSDDVEFTNYITRVYIEAAKCGHLEELKYLCSIGCLDHFLWYHRDVVINIMNTSNVDVVKYLLSIPTFRQLV